MQKSTSGSTLGNIAGALLGGQSGTATNKTVNTLAQAGSNMLGNLLGNVLGTNKVTDQTLVGTWQYSGVDCVFESENFLAQAGGEMAATTLEGKIDGMLQKVGIKPGSCSFTFKSDHTYTATLAGKTLSGQWTLDAEKKQLNMTYLMGLGSLTPKVAMNNGQLSLLFESSKLLTLVQGVGALTGNSTVKSVSSLLGNYKGLYIGLQMKK